MLHALLNNKIVFVPYIHSESGLKSNVMDLLQLRDEHDLNTLSPDSWGIPSLDKGSVHDRKNALGGFGIVGGSGKDNQTSPLLDLILMPAVAFDRAHNRLGHGKGFYDRYLQRYQNALEVSSGAMPALSKKRSASKIASGSLMLI